MKRPRLRRKNKSCWHDAPPNPVRDSSTVSGWALASYSSGLAGLGIVASAEGQTISSTVNVASSTFSGISRSSCDPQMRWSGTNRGWEG